MPPGGRDGATHEHDPVAGMVADPDTLAGSEKHRLVLADDIAAAHGNHACGAAPACSDGADASPVGNLVEDDNAPICGGLAGVPAAGAD